jgi:PKD repeat protein
MTVWQLVDAVIVNFSFDPMFSRPGQTVSFTDLSGNLEPNEPCLHEWDFGDGSPHVFTKNATHIYNRPGNFSVMKWVTGSKNLTRALKTLTFPVGEAPSPTVCDGTAGNIAGIIIDSASYLDKWYLLPDGRLGACKQPYTCLCTPKYSTKYQCNAGGSEVKIQDNHPDCCKFCGMQTGTVPHVAAPLFEIVSVTVTPTTSPKPGDLITAVASVSNKGDAAGAATISFTFNDGTYLGIGHITTGIINVNSTVNSPPLSGKAPATGTYNLCAQIYGQ